VKGIGNFHINIIQRYRDAFIYDPERPPKARGIFTKLRDIKKIELPYEHNYLDFDPLIEATEDLINRLEFLAQDLLVVDEVNIRDAFELILKMELCNKQKPILDAFLYAQEKLDTKKFLLSRTMFDEAFLRKVIDKNQTKNTVIEHQFSLLTSRQFKKQLNKYLKTVHTERINNVPNEITECLALAYINRSADFDLLGKVCDITSMHYFSQKPMGEKVKLGLNDLRQYMEQADIVKEQLWAEGLLLRFKLLNKAEKFLFCGNIKRILSIRKLYYKLKFITSQKKPQKIIGCFEKSPIGNILQCLKPKTFELSCVQHGFVMPQGISKTQHYDQFYVWSDYDKTFILRDGFKNTEKIIVRTDLAELKINKSQSEHIERNKQGGKKIGIILQPRMGGVIYPCVYDNFMKIIEDLIRSDQELYIRLHPAMSYEDIPDLVRLAKSNKLVRLTTPKDEELAEFCANINYCFGMGSTALLQARLLGIKTFIYLPDFVQKATSLDSKKFEQIENAHEILANINW